MNEPQNETLKIKLPPSDTANVILETIPLRDYFAAHALEGELSSQERGAALFEQSPENSELMARRAYQFADAMLKARAAK